MVSATCSTLEAAKFEAKALFSKREGLEAEVKAAVSQLKATGIQEHGSLVDREVCSSECLVRTQLHCVWHLPKAQHLRGFKC